MKNKKLIYLLLPMVLAIWGFIGYKIYTSISGQQQHTQQANVYNPSTDKGTVPDTFTLIGAYRDPFLQGVVNAANIRYSDDNELYASRNELHVAAKPAVVFPEILYAGIITNTKKKQKVGLVRITGRDVLVHEGEQMQNLKILHLYKDSLIVLLKKDKKTFYKNR